MQFLIRLDYFYIITVYAWGPSWFWDSRMEYQVEAILQKKKYQGKVYYKIKWLGYRLDESTWEPEENLNLCPKMLQKFNQTAISSRKKPTKLSTCLEGARKKKRSRLNQSDRQTESGILSSAEKQRSGREQGSENYKQQNTDKTIPSFNFQRYEDTHGKIIKKRKQILNLEGGSYVSPIKKVVGMFMDSQQNVIYRIRRGPIEQKRKRGELIFEDPLIILQFYEQHIKSNQY